MLGQNKAAHAHFFSGSDPGCQLRTTAEKVRRESNPRTAGDASNRGHKPPGDASALKNTADRPILQVPIEGVLANERKKVTGVVSCADPGCLPTRGNLAAVGNTPFSEGWVPALHRFVAVPPPPNHAVLTPASRSPEASDILAATGRQSKESTPN